MYHIIFFFCWVDWHRQGQAKSRWSAKKKFFFFSSVPKYQKLSLRTICFNLHKARASKLLSRASKRKEGTLEDGRLPACLLRRPSLCMTWTWASVTRLALAYVSSPAEGSGAAMWHLLPWGWAWGGGWDWPLCSPGLSGAVAYFWNLAPCYQPN